MSKISAVISAYNEEKKIDGCLESVSFADEIIVVNNSSTDKTSQIAKKYTSKIFDRENNPMLNINKNFGFTKATSDWILCLDADERVSPELAKEIKEALSDSSGDSSSRQVGTQNNKVVNAYWIPRKNIIFGKWIKYSGWYPDYQLRLFKKESGKFPEKHVHEMIEIKGETDHLRGEIIHYNQDNIAHFLNKHLFIYAPNEAEQLIEKGYVFNYLDAIRFPFKEFLSRFFAREGYKDGLHGLVLSILMAFYHFTIFTILWEKEGFKEVDKNILKETEKEFKHGWREMTFWFNNENIKNTKNPLGKFLGRIKHFV